MRTLTRSLAAALSLLACFSPPEQQHGDRVAEVSALEGCWEVTTTNRVGIRGVAEERGLCAAFTIVGGTVAGADGGIVFDSWEEESWSVHPAPCSGWGDEPVDPVRTIQGDVHFVSSSAGRPAADVDVTLLTGLANPPEIRLFGTVREYGRCN